jgi:L-iditol 2-dehydrogenase
MAVVKTERGPGHVALLDVPEPEVRPGWVVLEVSGAGICGTDIHIVEDEHPYWPPVTLGHEFAGRVAEVGDGAEGWAPGDRVVCEPHAGACGTCHLCRRGLVQLCAHKRSPGWGIDGALAPRVAVPAHLLHRVPDEVSDRAAAVCEPTAVCVSAFERMPAGIGETVVVVGPGPIGILAALIARATGAGRVILIGRGSSARRLDVAAGLGLEVWRSDERDVVSDALDATDGRGVDLVVDTSGAGPAIASGVRMLRRRGRMCALGVAAGDVEFPYADAMHRALDLTFSLSSSPTAWDGALALMRSGAIDVEPLVTSFPLAAWEDAFAALARREVVKAVLTP